MEWREIGREQVADCRVFSVERSICESPTDATRHEFYRLRSRDWVQILPVTAERDAVLVRQYRHGVQRVTLEIPAGLIEPDESPAEAAIRECLEETGYRAATVNSLGVLEPNPALFANRLYAFSAEGVELAGSIQNTDREHTEIELVPIGRLRALILDGTIDHALVVAVLWRYLHEHRAR
jgi:ADP-ribose pyrophosphatase